VAARRRASRTTNDSVSSSTDQGAGKRRSGIVYSRTGRRHGAAGAGIEAARLTDYQTR